MSQEIAMWPSRSVAEFAYCPRLFYYMGVEGVFIPSVDTEIGAGVHTRVDRPSNLPEGTPASRGIATLTKGEAITTEEVVEDPQRPRSIRSLTLTSATLELTAVLDIAEIQGTTAVPVEYRKGKPKRPWMSSGATDELMETQALIPGPEPWPTDRVQVGLQVLLLEEAGYTVPEAWLYYASEKLKLRVTVDDALRTFARDTLEAAKQCALGTRPPPLLNDPKCPRCSLQPICLPDEINFQRTTPVTFEGLPLFKDAPVELPTPRRMWPPRDDGIHVVIQKEAVKVGVRGQSVRVTNKDGELVREVPLANIESLALRGSVQVSTQALAVFADHEVPVAYLSAAGRLVAMMDPLGPTSAAVRASQVRELDKPHRALELARAVTVAKIANQRTLLMRNHIDLPSRAAAELLSALHAAEKATSMDVLRGHEGNAAAIYFANLTGMLKSSASTLAQQFVKHGRQRRPPPDPINSVLSFAYSMLANECTVACRLASLEPTIGALHSTRPGRPALSLDLMEPFRPLIADSIVVSAFNRGELVEGHFNQTAAGCSMTEHGRKAFFGAYARRMDTEVTHPVFEYRLSYRRMLMLHARLVAAWLQGEVPTLSFLTTR